MLGVSGLLGNSGDGGGEVGVAPPEIGGVSEEDKGRVEESDRSSGGNRWPRQETLALLKIRSDMDVAFRDSSLKGPLWDEVSRKLAELGYNRNAKKCKEKFENVYKYHRRTKEGRSTKPEGKTYRFFDQLQALENHNNISLPLPLPQNPQPPLLEAPQHSVTVPSQTSPSIPSQINRNPTTPPPPPPPAQQQPPPPTNPSQNRNFPVNFMTSSPSSSSSTSSDEEPERRCKRKRKWEYFFERVMKEVIQKQEEMQKSFLEALEKRERDRAVREEAWRVQEMERMNREHELLVQERAMAAAKDAAVMNFLQKVAEQQNPNAAQMKIQTQMPIPIPVPVSVQENPIQQQNPNVTQMKIQTQINALPVQESPIAQQNPNAAQVRIQTQLPIPVLENPVPQQTQKKFQTQNPMPTPTPPPAPVPVQENPIPQQNANAAQMKIQTQMQENPKVTDHNGGEKFNTSTSSRWPKPEVEALIKLRTNLDMKYQENGPKGPLWEEISTSMTKLGYNRSSKRCKEKWENINKYFKKVKESNKRRPEDSKTCPYFHQLDALYREKKHIGFSNSFDSGLAMKPEISSMVPIMAQPEQQWPHPQMNQTAMEDQESENHDDGDDDNEDEEDEGGGYEVVANKPSSVATTVE